MVSAGGDGRRRHAAALGAARAPQDDRHQVRLRHRGLRRLHRACRRQAGALLHHAGVDWSKARRSPPSRACRPTAAIRCRRPGSPSRCRNAATASPDRSCRRRRCSPRNKTPTREQIVEHMDGNICRCGTYLQDHQRDPARGAGGLSHDTVSINRRDFLGTTAAGLTFALTLRGAIRSTLVGEAQRGCRARAQCLGHISRPTAPSPSCRRPPNWARAASPPLPLIFAEELDADWSKVKPVQPPAWDDQALRQSRLRPAAVARPRAFP